MAIFKAFVAERIRPGSLVFWWQSDGKLRPREEPESAWSQPVGIARVELLPGQLIEITEGDAMRAAGQKTDVRLPRGLMVPSYYREIDPTTGNVKPPAPAPINRHIVEMLERLKR